MSEKHARLSVGIVGYGRIGAEHGQWIDASHNARVSSVFDPTEARAVLARTRGLHTVDTVEKLLADDSIDIILVASPTSMHFDHASRAIDAGKHVMIEKPVTLDAAQAQDLRTRADRGGVKLCVFQCRRWDIDFLTAKRAIVAGTFGRVFNVESRLGQWASCVGPAAKEYHPNWRNERAFGGGGLYDWGSHFVDQLWQLMFPAKPVQVFAQLRGNVWTKDCDDFARVIINFDNGAIGLCEINTTTTRPLPRWHIDGELGSAGSPPSLAFDTREWAKLSFTRAADGETLAVPVAAPGMNETQIWEAFVDSIRADSAPPITLDSVLITMRLLDAARESSATGKAVAYSDRPGPMAN